MRELTLEDIGFIRVLANSDPDMLNQGMNEATMIQLNAKIVPILREYYLENTVNSKTDWTEKFENVGITEDDGKAAIACARRLGIYIS